MPATVKILLGSVYESAEYLGDFEFDFLPRPGEVIILAVGSNAPRRYKAGAMIFDFKNSGWPASNNLLVELEGGGEPSIVVL
jgi:hypothetical protein